MLVIHYIYTGNVAYNKTASQLGNYDGHMAPRAVDGDIGPKLGDNHCAHPDNNNDGKQPPAWWSVDLGNQCEISNIVLFARNQLYGSYHQVKFNTMGSAIYKS